MFSLILGLVAVGFALWRLTVALRNKSKEGGFPQFSLLLFMAGAFLIVAHFFEVAEWIATVFWVTLLAAAIVAAFVPFKISFGLAIAVFVINAIVLLPIAIVLAPDTNSSASVTEQSETVKIEASNGKTETLERHGDEKDKVLAAHETVNDTFATASLPGHQSALTSWTDLWNRVETLPEADKTKYVSAFNEATALGLKWDDVPLLVDAEARGFESRVIQAINVNLTDEQVRSLAKELVGDLAAALPVVTIEGATVTTNGGTGSNFVLTKWADERPGIHISLTIPADLAHPTANVNDASKFVGVDTICANIGQGIIPRDHLPKKKTQPTPTTAPPTTAPPTTAPPTTAPPTTAPPTTAPPTTAPPTTAPPTTAPPTTAPPTTAPPTTAPPTTAPPTTAPPTTAPPTTAPPTTAPPTTAPPTTAPPTTAPPTTAPPTTAPPTTAPPTTAPPTTAPPTTAPPTTAPPTTAPPTTAPPGKVPSKEPQAPSNGTPVTAEPTAAPPRVEETAAPDVYVTPSAPAPVETPRTEVPTAGPNEGAPTEAPVIGTVDEEECAVCGGGISSSDGNLGLLIALPILLGLGGIAKKYRWLQRRGSH